MGCSLDLRSPKVRSRLLWAMGMLSLGTAETVLNVLNLVALSDPDLRRCLVTGPTPPTLWLVLLIFTVVSVVLYVPESVNTVSVVPLQGETGVSILWELYVILSLETIPLSCVNYFIARSRGEYATPLQNLSGGVRAVYGLLRMVWYAHMEGRKMRDDDKYSMRTVLFMGVCALYSSSLAFPITSWREQTDTNINVTQASARVSVFFLRLPATFDDVSRDDMRDVMAERLFEQEGYDPDRAYLVESIASVIEAGEGGVTASYACADSTTFLPPECTLRPSRVPADSLHFRLVFDPNAPLCPVGEIRYNYAAVKTSLHGNPVCDPVSREAEGSWRVRYYLAVHYRDFGGRHVNLTVPWLDNQIIPEPTHDTTISVCGPAAQPPRA